MIVNPSAACLACLPHLGRNRLPAGRQGADGLGLTQKQRFGALE